MPVTLNKKYARPIGGKLCNNSLVETMGLKTTNPLSQQVANILAKYGSNAHVYMPGVGYVQGMDTYNYLDSVGTTYSTVDGLVGLDLDAGGTVGPELIADTSFDNPAYWSLSATAPATAVVSGSQVSLVSPAGEMSSIERFNAFTTGKTYRVELDIAYFTGTAAIYSGSVTIAILGIGKFVAHITTNNQTIGIKRLGNCNLVVRSISVKEVTGIHASQATTGYKPYLRRGAINLVNYSEQLDNAYWTKASSTTGTPGNDGLSLISATATTSFISRSDIATTVGVDYTLSVDLKKDTTTDPAIRVMTAANAANVGRLALNWTGDAPTAGNITGDVRDVVIADNGNGVFRVSFKTAATSTVSSVLVYTTGAGAALKNVYAGKIQFQQGTLTDYIRTTSAPASSQSGNYFWQFDGTDDRLTLGSVPFQMTDDHCVIAGSKCESTAATAKALFYVGASSDVPRVASLGFAGAATSPPNVVWRDDAGTVVLLTHSQGMVGSACVATARKVNTLRELRVNGVQSASSSVAFGATTLTAASVGSHTNGTMNYFKGSIYAIVAIKGTVSDADLLAIEKWVGKLSGVTI